MAIFLKLSLRDFMVYLTIHHKPTDFEDLKESYVIELLKAASIISKEQKKVLDEKLEVRNSAAHPNSTSFKEPKVVTFIDELFTDVVFKLQ